MVTPVSEVRTYLTLGAAGSACDVAGADATTARATAAAAPILAFTLRMVIDVPLFRSTDTTETSPTLGRPLHPGLSDPPNCARQNLVDLADASVDRVSALEDMLAARRDRHELP